MALVSSQIAGLGYIANRNIEITVGKFSKSVTATKKLTCEINLLKLTKVW